MRLLIIQFGNFAEGERRLTSGGKENYYAQRYTINFVAELVRRGCQVCVITIGEDYATEQLPSGVQSAGLSLYRGRFRRPRTRELIGMVENWRPTHLLLQSPIVGVLHWALRQNVEILPLFADSFCATGLRRRLWYRRLAAALNDPAIRWVVNHGANAAADLVRIGVDPRKVLPFDWPELLSPSRLSPKKAPSDPSSVRLTYIGQITAAKGVGDLIASLAIAKSKTMCYQAKIAGAGDVEKFRKMAHRLGVEPQIEFAGKVSHDQVLRLMNDGDAVIVPSRPEYPEGIPQTIYEGLASRSPVVVSDHPMFRGRIVHRKSGMVFRAADSGSLFDSIHELVSDKALYERLSHDAVDICRRFHGPLKWDQVITRWLSATPEDDRWLRRFALSH